MKLCRKSPCYRFAHLLLMMYANMLCNSIFFPPVSDAPTEPAADLDASILTDTNADDSAGEHTTEVLSQLPDADADIGSGDDTSGILSQLPDAPTTDPVDPPEATGPDSKKQKTAEDTDTDDGFVLVDRTAAGDGKKKEL
jgi:hypothetical protein